MGHIVRLQNAVRSEEDITDDAGVRLLRGEGEGERGDLHLLRRVR